MKLSIWQQFSSNHSADFTIVGSFDTKESAEQAAKIVRETMQRIIAWYDEHLDEREAVVVKGAGEATPVEENVASKYGIEHNSAIDHLANMIQYDDRLVTVYEKHVFVTNVAQTWSGPTLFDQLMEKLGGDVAVDVEAADTIIVTVTCKASDQPTGEDIISQSALERNQTVVKAYPWIVNHVNPPNPEAYLKQVQQFATSYKKILALSNSLSVEEQIANVKLLQKLNDVTACFTSSSPSGVSLDGVHLEFQGVRFSKISFGLPAFIAWLESKGCQDISFKVEQQKWQLPPGLTEDDL